MSLFPQEDETETVFEAMHRYQAERNKIALYALQLTTQINELIEIGCEQCDLDMSSSGPAAIEESRKLIDKVTEYIQNIS